MAPSNNSSDDEVTSESDIDDDFENDIATLRDYSFISTIEDGNMFTIHRLVQLTTRAWLKNRGKIAIWTERFIKTLCDEFPVGNYENWEKCRVLFPHVKLAMFQRPGLLSPESRKSWATLLYNGRWYSLKTGNIADTIEMASESRREIVRLLGIEDEDSLNSLALLGMAYEQNGQWRKAEKLQVQVMETSKTKFGEDHPSTLANMGNLASTFISQDRYKEAERLQTQAMEISKKNLGEDHPFTLISMGNLASTFWSQGRYKETEKLEIQVMEISKTKLGEYHPDTLTSMDNLALALERQGHYKEAERLQLQVMKISKMKLGDDYPSTLTSMSNLSWTWNSLGQISQAVNLLQDCLARQEKTLGIDHPETISTSRKLLEWKSENLDQ
ncbi:hypothetical protein N7507_003704 [Penicillium longicatenatum]|nr:hypothetical protein N7507_003704 [Penicillium longicatenatum]